MLSRDTPGGGKEGEINADQDYVRAEKRLPREGEVERVTGELDQRRAKRKESEK